MSRPAAIVIDLTASESDRPVSAGNRSAALPEKEPIALDAINIADDALEVQGTPVASSSKRSIRDDDEVVVLKAVKPPAPARKATTVITVTNSSPVSKATEAKKCPICLDPLSRPSVTTCGHIFCTSCIHAAVQAHQMCPICRKRLPKKGGYHSIFL